MPRISVIMNCAYGARFLREAIDSVFAQSFRDWEIVFVDNCSTDGSAEIACAYANSGRIRYIRTEERIPLYAARNVGIAHCSGTYISFHDVDDILETDMLKNLHEKIEGGASMVYGGYRYVGEVGNFLGRDVQGRARGDLTSRLLLRSFVAVGCVLVRSEVFRKTRFDPSYNIIGDFEMWTRISAAGCICEPVERFLTRIRVHGGNLSIVQFNRWIMEERRFYRQFLSKHGLRYPAILVYILKAELSHLLQRKRI